MAVIFACRDLVSHQLGVDAARYAYICGAFDDGAAVGKKSQLVFREHQAEREAPSLWQLAKRATSEDSRRGLSFMTLVLSGLGRSLKN